MSQETRNINVNLDLNPADLHDIDDLYNAMTLYQNTFNGLVANLQSGLKRISNLRSYLITVIVGDESKAFMIDQIDLPKGFNKLIETAQLLGVSISKEAYRESYEFFVKESLDSELGIYHSTRFIGVNVYVTRLPSSKEQQERAKKDFMESFIDINFREKEGVKFLDMNIRGLPVKQDASKPS